MTQVSPEPLVPNNTLITSTLEEGRAFYVTNHGDLLQVLGHTRERGAVPETEAAEFTIGLKLLSEVLLRHRQEPLFAELFPHLGNFIKKLKNYSVDA